MAADPADCGGDLEARVTRLEQRVGQQLEHKIDATAYGVSLVHEDVRAIRERLDWVSQVQEQHGERLGGIDQKLDSHGELLQEILRLPPAD